MDINAEKISSIEDFEKIVQKEPSKQEPAIWPVMLLYIIFPPIGLFYAWRKKILQHILPLVTSFYSILFLISLFRVPSTLKPIEMLSKELGTISSPVPTYMQILLIISYILGALGIISGLYFRFRVKVDGYLDKKITILLFSIIFIEIFLEFGVHIFLSNYTYSLLTPSMGF